MQYNFRIPQYKQQYPNMTFSETYVLRFLSDAAKPIGVDVIHIL